MQDIPDCELLGRFARSGSEEAFTELVRRHINLVYSVALRHTENAQHAQEITQAVFILLARKTAALGRQTVLSGWLYHTARLMAANFRRAEIRHVRREQEAYVQSTLEESTPDALWREVAPMLDEAMAHLDATDRDAVVLRYFEKQDLRAVGGALGISEDAAQKRVSRAVERLREFFAKRGVTIGASGLAVAITANAVQAAPIGLAVTISSTATLAETSLATTATVTATKAIAMTTLQKTLVTTIAVASIVTPLLVQHRALVKARMERSALLTHLRDLPVEAPTTSDVAATDNRAQHEREDLQRLRRETAALRARISELATQAQRFNAANPSQKVSGTPIGETLRLAEIRDAGQATPAALFQTYWWAMLHADTNRLAQIMAFDPQMDMLVVQRFFDTIAKGGMEAELAKAPPEVRLLEEQPAENNDRWIVIENLKKDGAVARRARVRVRLIDAGWKLVTDTNGPVAETIDVQP